MADSEKRDVSRPPGVVRWLADQVLVPLGNAIKALFVNLTSPDVLKIPVIAACGVLALLFLDRQQIASFKFGPNGIEVTRQDLQKVQDKATQTVASVDNNSKTNGQLVTDMADAKARITALEHTIVALSAQTSHATSPDPQKAAAQTLQAAIDKTAGADVDIASSASIARPVGDHSGTLLGGQKGYIFLGDRNGDGNFNRVFIKTETGTPVSAVAQVNPGQRYSVSGNMVLRYAKPDPNSLAYFRSIQSLGTLPPGSLVTVLSPPSDLVRGQAHQIWAYVEVAK